MNFLRVFYDNPEDYDLSKTLAFQYPNIAKEFSYKNGISSDFVFAQSGKMFLWECLKCGNEWQAIVQHRTIHSSGCPECNGKRSLGEQIIYDILYNNNIVFVEQKKFEGCKYKKSLRFDFYIPSLNLCIEYNGEQHYKPIEYFGGDDVFEKQIIKDDIKYKFCKEENINLLIISYKEIDKINSILKLWLKKKLY